MAFAAQLREQHGFACIGAEGVFATALLCDGLPRFVAEAEDLEPRYLMASYAED